MIFPFTLIILNHYIINFVNHINDKANVKSNHEIKKIFLEIHIYNYIYNLYVLDKYEF